VNDSDETMMSLFIARKLSFGVIAVGCALAIVACGSSKSSGTATSSTYATGVKYSDCMRSHGVPNFPDPSPSGQVPGAGNSAINEQSPGFQSAASACAQLQPGAGVPHPAITEAELNGMLRNAQCIRAHGVPNFPDPTITPTNTPGSDPVVPSDINTRAPAVQQAARACARVGTVIPGVGYGRPQDAK
jgi:hypothetical protein